MLPAFSALKHLADATTQHDVSEYTVSVASQTSPVRLVCIDSQTSPQASHPRQFFSPSSSLSLLPRNVCDATLGDDGDGSKAEPLSLTTPSPTIPSLSHGVQRLNAEDQISVNATEKENRPERRWGVILTSVGVWALVFMSGKYRQDRAAFKFIAFSTMSRLHSWTPLIL